MEPFFLAVKIGEGQDDRVYKEGNAICIWLEQKPAKREEWRKKSLLWYADFCKFFPLSIMFIEMN